jgi:hypothetical protein
MHKYIPTGIYSYISLAIFMLLLWSAYFQRERSTQVCLVVSAFTSYFITHFIGFFFTYDIYVPALYIFNIDQKVMYSIHFQSLLVISDLPNGVDYSEAKM